MKKIIYDENGLVKKVLSVPTGVSRTQQQFKEQCDVNQIIKKFKKTGELTHVRSTTGRYIDNTTLPSYQQSLDIVIKATSLFADLPSDIRKKFQNDPAELLKFLDDPKNNAEAIKLGLKTEIKQSPEDPTLTALKEIAQNTKNATNAKKRESANKNEQSED